MPRQCFGHKPITNEVLQAIKEKGIKPIIKSRVMAQVKGSRDDGFRILWRYVQK